MFLEEYGNKKCPKNGIITCDNDEIKCSIHINEKDEEVPYLD